MTAHNLCFFFSSWCEKSVYILYSHIEIFFTIAEKRQSLFVTENDVCSRLASATCSSSSMDEGINMSYCKLDNCVDIIDVETTSCHVSRYQNRLAAWSSIRL